MQAYVMYHKAGTTEGRHQNEWTEDGMPRGIPIA